MKRKRIVQTQNKRIGLFYLAHDGITSHYAGIGTYTKSYLDNLPKIIEDLKKYKLHIDLYLVTPWYKKEFYGYNKDLKQNNLNLAKRFKGKVIEVDNGMGGLDSYGNTENWDQCSKNTAEYLSRYLRIYDSNIVIAVDTPFLRVGEFLNECYCKKNLKVVLSPQSTERIHHSNISGRYEWEKKVFFHAENSKNIFVSYSSLYIKRHLSQEYGISRKKLIPSMSGLSFSSTRYKKYSQKYIAQQLAKYGIPLNRPLVFTVGRLEPYKGFEETIKLFKQINSKFNPYLILLGFSYIKGNPLVSKLREMKKNEKIHGKFIFHLDLILPTLIWQWKNSKISAHLSQFEPFGLAPVEARFLAKDSGPVVIVSDQGGLKEQISNNTDGFVATYGSVGSYRNIVEKIFGMNPANLCKIRAKAYSRVMKKYDSYRNILILLTYLDKDIKIFLKKRGDLFL